METKICKSCGRDLPADAFRLTRWGSPANVCNACQTEKSAQTRYERRHQGGKQPPPFSDPDFDGKNPREVWRMMCRGKRWLESRGFIIQLAGEYHETKIRKLKCE